jgi:hypothetical protein
MNARMIPVLVGLLIITVAAGCKRATRPATTGTATTGACQQNFDTCEKPKLPCPDGTNNSYIEINDSGSGSVNPQACCLSIQQKNQAVWHNGGAHDHQITFTNASPFGTNIPVPHGQHAPSGPVTAPVGCYDYTVKSGDPTIIITK